MRVLTPTENNRLNELIGFLGVTIAVLMALALISYSPHDASLNVSAQSSDLRSARNWIGPVGAYSADLLFQGFGYAVFLLPIGIFLVGTRWFRSVPLESPAIKIVGYFSARADGSRVVRALALAGGPRSNSCRRLTGTFGR